jgi:predicted DNA-binding protein
MVREYPQVSLRLPPETKAKLQALSAVSAMAQWRIVTAALDCFFRERSAVEQRQVLSHMASSSARRASRHSRL